MRTNLHYILFACIVVLLYSANVKGQEIDSITKVNIPAERDNAQFPNDSLTPLIEKEITLQDTTKTDSTEQKNGMLTDDIIQTAKDKILFDRKTQRAYLYNEAKIVYGDLTLEAGLIILDNQTREVYAFGVEDSTGTYTQKPVFTQGNRVVKPDSIRFNFDTRKALVYNSRTEQGAFKVKGEVTKRVNDSVYFMRHVKFTTSEDIEDPEYYFYARKVKFVPGKKVVSGLVNMYIADVPTPLGFPFGYFPLTKDRASGFIIPSFGNSRNRGYSLQNGGYYFAISDYLDLTALGDYYSNGSYGIRLDSDYKLRYQFNGNVSFRYEKLLNSERGFPDFAETSIYNIRWRHDQDQKASPNSRFSANVNLGSSKYYRQSVNQSNSGNHLNNSLSSSISYSKTFPGEPEFRFSLTASHKQNTNTEEINMTLPNLQASVSRIYPFEPKSGVKKGIFQNINFQYNVQGKNQFNTTDSLFFKPEMFRNARMGVQHSIPVSTNFKIFDYFSVSTGANYEENWLFKTYERSYDEQRQEVVVDTVQGFDSYRTYNFNANVGTTIYGLFKFGEKNKIQAMRHVMKPSITYSLTPAFDNFYDTYLIPETSGMEEELVEYSRFEGSLYGAPNKNYASNIGFSLNNDFEAKIQNKDSIGAEPEKRKLLSNFRLSTSYNMAADSLKLQPIRVSGTLPVVKDKLDVNFNGALDPYALNNSNQRVDKLNTNNGGSLFRLTCGNISFSYSLSNTDFQESDKNTDKSENETFRNGGRPDDLFGKAPNRDGTFEDDEDEAEGPVEDETERYNYKIPWNLRMSYTMTYNNARRENEISSHSLMFSGDVDLSPRWKVGVSSGYDLKNKGFTYTQLRFQRDLKSWRMSFNWTPFGTQKSWFFFIGIKASVLSDIKYDKRRERDRSF